MYKNIQNKKGFTIVELFLVIVIISILLTVTTSTFLEERNRFQFNDSLIKTINLIKTARNYALTNRDINGSIPKEGYGIHIKKIEPYLYPPNSSRIILFANTSDVSIKKDQYNDGEDAILETYYFPNSAKFELIEGTLLDANKITPNESVIIFRPPFATTYLGNNNISNPREFNDLAIKLAHRFFALVTQRYIKINNIGGFPELEIPSS